MKPKGNGRWFYFWYKTNPQKVLAELSNYSGKSLTELENFNKIELHDLAEKSGLIKNDNELDRSSLNDAVSHSTVNVVQYAMRMYY